GPALGGCRGDVVRLLGGFVPPTETKGQREHRRIPVRPRPGAMDDRGCASASRTECCDLRGRFRELPCGESTSVYGGTLWGPTVHRATPHARVSEGRASGNRIDTLLLP